MSIEKLEIRVENKRYARNMAAGAIDIAIRDAEIHGTTLAVKTNGKIEELTPKQMRARLKKRFSKKKTAKKKA